LGRAIPTDLIVRILCQVRDLSILRPHFWPPFVNDLDEARPEGLIEPIAMRVFDEPFAAPRNQAIIARAILARRTGQQQGEDRLRPEHLGHVFEGAMNLRYAKAAR